MLIPLIVACSFFMENLDGTIIVTALPQMAQTFGVRAIDLSVGVTAYMLTLAVFIPASGWAADRWGTRNVYFMAIIGFTAASVLCGFSTSLWQFTTARILQGMAAAMMSPVGRLLVFRTAEKKDLMRAVSTITWPGLVAPIIGPPLGGFITTYSNWRWIFFVNIPIGLLGVALVLSFIPNRREETPRPFDALGFLFAASSLASLLYGLNMAGHQSGAWAQAGLFLVCGVILGTLGIRHFIRVKHPLIDLSPRKVHSYAVAVLLGGSLSRTAVGATPFLLPLLFQIGFGMSPLESGMFVLAYASGNLLMKVVTTPTMRLFGFRRVLILSGAITGLAVSACALLTAQTPLFITLPLLLVAGLARSMQFTALNTLAFADIAPQQRASATTLMSMTIQISFSAGVAVAAMMTNISVLARGAIAPGLFDLRVALVMIGVIGMISTFWFISLPHDAGHEVSGHKPQPKAVPGREEN